MAVVVTRRSNLQSPTLCGFFLRAAFPAIARYSATVIRSIVCLNENRKTIGKIASGITNERTKAVKIRIPLPPYTLIHGDGRDRTFDLRVNGPLLYHLSYIPMPPSVLPKPQAAIACRKTLCSERVLSLAPPCIDFAAHTSKRVSQPESLMVANLSSKNCRYDRLQCFHRKEGM